MGATVNKGGHFYELTLYIIRSFWRDKSRSVYLVSGFIDIQC